MSTRLARKAKLKLKRIQKSKLAFRRPSNTSHDLWRDAERGNYGVRNGNSAKIESIRIDNELHPSIISYVPTTSLDVDIGLDRLKSPIHCLASAKSRTSLMINDSNLAFSTISNNHFANINKENTFPQLIVAPFDTVAKFVPNFEKSNNFTDFDLKKTFSSSSALFQSQTNIKSSFAEINRINLNKRFSSSSTLLHSQTNNSIFPRTIFSDEAETLEEGKELNELSSSADKEVETFIARERYRRAFEQRVNSGQDDVTEYVAFLKIFGHHTVGYSRALRAFGLPPRPLSAPSRSCFRTHRRLSFDPHHVL